MKHHLAEMNIGRMRAPIDDPIMQEFVEQIAYINALADQAAGFVWRLQGKERLELLTREGASARAFTFKQLYSASGEPMNRPDRVDWSFA